MKTITVLSWPNSMCCGSSAGTIQKFEATGFAAVLKDNYVALHDLEHRITEMHLAHARAIEV